MAIAIRAQGYSEMHLSLKFYFFRNADLMRASEVPRDCSASNVANPATTMAVLVPDANAPS